MEELIIDGLRQMFHNLKVWMKSRYHLHQAKKRQSVVELLISMCYDEEESRWQYTKEKSEIVCEISTGTYHALNTYPATLTLIDGFHIPTEYQEFVDTIFANDNLWPQGVEFSADQDGAFRISISVLVDLDYKDDPKGYMRGYMNYLHELQTSLHKHYNQYRETHNPHINYNIPNE